MAVAVVPVPRPGGGSRHPSADRWPGRHREPATAVHPLQPSEGHRPQEYLVARLRDLGIAE